MPRRSTKRTATEMNKDMSPQAGMFSGRGKARRKGHSIEKMLIDALRKEIYDELCDKLRTNLGDGFTDEIAEEAFGRVIKKAEETGLIQEMLDDYLQLKMDDERVAFDVLNAK